MKFVAPLSDEQREELERARRTAGSHRERTRTHAVLLSAQGYRIGELAAILGAERDAVSRWLARWERGGTAALADRPRAGRPPSVGGCEQAQVVAAATLHPASPQRALAKKGALMLAGTR